MTQPGFAQVPGYPVEFNVEPQLTGRNRLTTGFRLILGIPQFIIVGVFNSYGASALTGGGGGHGVRLLVRRLVQGRRTPRLVGFHHVMRWWVRVAGYAALLRDDSPPFGDEPYPTTYGVTYPAGGRNRPAVGLRLIYVIPHLVVPIFVNIAWTATTIIAWFAILFTGAYPAGLYRFAVGAMRWNVRVHSYLLLLRDEYPPFSLAG